MTRLVNALVKLHADADITIVQHMVDTAEEWRDEKTGEIGCTRLAEAACWEYDLDPEGELNEWVFDVAVDIAEELD